MMRSFHSSGKLLISGEYVVLDGAEALAIATKQGQRMDVEPAPGSDHRWTALDEKGNVWLDLTLDQRLHASMPEPLAAPLIQILTVLKDMAPERFQDPWDITTRLEFPRDWGLGSSSTLLCNLAKWAELDAFELSAKTLGGSGYDIAVGMVGSELIYSSPPSWDSFSWNPSFSDQLYFVHLNRKQDSRAAIRAYREHPARDTEIGRIGRMAREMAACGDVQLFAELMQEHEAIMSQVLRIQTVKDRLFPDFPGELKSLGAWGGDFILACTPDDASAYFKRKGHAAVVPFDKMRKR